MNRHFNEAIRILKKHMEDDMVEGREAVLEDRVTALEQSRRSWEMDRNREAQFRDSALRQAIGATERGSGHAVITEYAQAFLNFLKG